MYRDRLLIPDWLLKRLKGQPPARISGFPTQP
jgi:hypothetical protein